MTSSAPYRSTRSKTSVSLGIFEPGTISIVFTKGSLGSVGLRVPQSSVLTCARVSVLMYLPTYGYSGSSGNAGAVSWHFTGLIWRSWVTTATPSSVIWTSSSSVLTPSRIALPNELSVLSGRKPRPPRWAWRSNVLLGADSALAAQMRATASASAAPRVASSPLEPNLLPTILVLLVCLPCCGPITRPPQSVLSQLHTEAVVGRSLERAHPVLRSGLGELARDLRRHGLRWCCDGHLGLAFGITLLERSPDGEGYAGILEVDEEGLAVGREGRSGELGVVQAVPGERIDLAIRGDAHDAIYGVAVIDGLVFGEPQVSPGRHHDVVRALHLARIGALVEQFQSIACRQVAEDLPEPRLAADGVVEPERSPGEVRAFEPVEPGGLQIFGALVRLLRVHVLPDDLEAIAGEGQVHVVVPSLIQGHNLEPAASLQSAGSLSAVVRDVTIEEADAGSPATLGVWNVGSDFVVGVVRDTPAEVVLGEVGDAGRRIYVNRLVREEA